jgi:hypothetical protein
MLNVAIGVGRGGGAPRLSGSRPGTGTEETGPVLAFTAAPGVLPSPTLRCFAFRRSSSLALPEPTLIGVPCRFPTLRIPLILDEPRPSSRTRLLPPLLVRALFFFLLVTFMATWDKTLRFTPHLVNSNPSFSNTFAWLRLNAKIPFTMCGLRLASCHSRILTIA